MEIPAQLVLPKEKLEIKPIAIASALPEDLQRTLTVNWLGSRGSAHRKLRLALFLAVGRRYLPVLLRSLVSLLSIFNECYQFRRM